MPSPEERLAAATRQIKERDELDEKYRQEGWGRVTDAALGIPPRDVESQARDVARWADVQLEAKDTVERHRRLEIARERVARYDAERELASLRVNNARLEQAMLEHESRTGERLFPLHAEGFKRWSESK